MITHLNNPSSAISAPVQSSVRPAKFQQFQLVKTGYGTQQIRSVDYHHERWVYTFFIKSQNYRYELDEVTLSALQVPVRVPEPIDPPVAAPSTTDSKQAVGFSIFQQIYKADYPYLSAVYRAADAGEIDAYRDYNARKGGAWRVNIPKADYDNWKLTQIETVPAVSDVEKAVA